MRAYQMCQRLQFSDCVRVATATDTCRKTPSDANIDLAEVGPGAAVVVGGRTICPQ